MKEGRRAFITRMAKYGGLATGTLAAPGLLAGCDAPSPILSPREDLQVIGLRVLREHADLVRAAEPITLVQMLASEEHMFTQAGRAIAAAYKYHNPNHITVIAVRPFERPSSERSTRVLWNYLKHDRVYLNDPEKIHTRMGDVRRYALVERPSSQGLPAIELVTIPSIPPKRSGVDIKMSPATVVPYGSMLAAAATVDIGSEYTQGHFFEVPQNNYVDWAKTILTTGEKLPQEELVDGVYYTKAMMALQEDLSRLLRTASGYGPSVDLRFVNEDKWRTDRQVEYFISGAGSDIAVKILEDALHVAGSKGMSLRKNTPYQTWYITRDTITMSKGNFPTLGEMLDSIDPRNVAPENASDTGPQFGRIVIPSAEKTYLVYFPSPQEAQR